MRLEHVGIAVNDAVGATEQLRRLLRIAPYRVETVPSEHVKTHFLSAGGTKLEVLESLHGASPIGRALEKRGQGVHHLAFEVDDLPAEMDRLRQIGITLLDEVPRRGADGKLIFFVHPHDTPGLLIEFCQTEVHLPAQWTEASSPRAGWIEAGSPLAPRLLLATASRDLPGQALEAELAREFLIMRPAEPWSGASAQGLSSLFGSSASLRFAATLSVASALESTMESLLPFHDRLGLRVLLDPGRIAARTLQSPTLIIAETRRIMEAGLERLSEEGAPTLVAVPGRVKDLCARDPRLVLDLVVRGMRFTSV